MEKVYVVGDSISIQYGPYLEAALEGRMGYARKSGEAEALLNLDNPQGANAGTSAMTLRFLESSAAAGGIESDYLLLNCGLHDIKADAVTRVKAVPLEDYRRNLQEIVRVVRSMQPELIWLRTTPVDETVHNRGRGLDVFHRYESDLEDYNRAADEVMTEAAVSVINLHGFTAGLGDDLFCDHVHFHDWVREAQGRYIADWLIQHRQA